MCYSQQTELNGLSGRIKFDDYGLRIGYSLQVMEITFGRSMATVGMAEPRPNQSN